MELLKEQNPWWIAKEKIEEDVNLEKLTTVMYRWHPRVLDSFETGRDAVYTLRGSRQVGKTTTLKLLVKKLLAESPKESIFYFTCNNVDNYQDLIAILRVYFDWQDNSRRKYIFVDEITFVKNWTRAIKHLADLGRLKNCTMILTGSNAHDLKYEVERMPGRRGRDPELDKILFPVSFEEYVGLVNPQIPEKFSNIQAARKHYPFYQKQLRECLEAFLLTGGFIQAINSFAADKKIGIDIYQQYLSWVLGDLARLGKKEFYSRQIFDRVIQSVTSNIGFDTIAQKTSIDSHQTVGDYLDVMASSFILKILYQIDISKKLAAPRKTKKIYFQDLFLFWVFLGYTLGLSDYFAASKKRLADKHFRSKLIENLIMTSLMRLENSVNWSNLIFFFRTVNQVEIDFAVRKQENRLLPIEVKYQNEVSPKDFRKLNKLNEREGVIISQSDFWSENNRHIMPAEVFLLLQDKILK